MKTNTFTIHGLAILLTLILVGTASADIGSEAGNWEYRYNAPETTAEVAAQNYEYDATALNKVGTEAGNWEYRFNTSETSAEIAAQDYQYNKDVLQRVGSEAGNWDYLINSAYNSNNSVTEQDSQKALCNNC